jgi:protein-S-isoprenylcysteine O-methyltransferase Ste14
MNRQQIYHWRGVPLSLVALLGIFLGQPSPTSFAWGSLLSLMGEGIRLWAIGYTGGPTRGIVLEAPKLVSAGPYAYVRNPLYVGNLLNGMAIVVAASGGLDGWRAALVIGLSGWLLWRFYRLIIDIEEEFLGDCFDHYYRDYCRAVPRLLPRLSPAGPQQGSYSLDRALFHEKSTLFWFVLVWTLIFWKV